MKQTMNEKPGHDRPSEPSFRETIPALGIKDVFVKFDTSPEGLSDEEARRRTARYGPNVIEGPAPRHSVDILARQFTNLFAVLLMAATVLAYVGRMPDLAIAIILVVLINGAAGFTQEYAATRISRALAARVPASANVLRQWRKERIPLEQVAVGDVIPLEIGDRVPADARLVEAYDLTVNNESITGESMPQPRVCRPVSDVSLVHSPNVVFLGTTVSSGSGVAVVFAVGSDTEVGKVAHIVRSVKAPKSPLENELDRAARLIATVAVILGSVFGVIFYGVGESTAATFLFSIGVVVALVPEGLPAVLTVTLSQISRRMARVNVLIKKPSAAEALGAATVICTDKTGTLTKGEMTVTEIWANGKRFHVSGTGFIPEGDLRRADDPGSVRRPGAKGGTKLTQEEADANLGALLEIGTLSNTAVLVAPEGKERRWRVLGSPTEGAILTLAQKVHFDVERASQRYPRESIFPFDRTRKMMSTVHSTDAGRVLYLKGAPDAVLGRSTMVAIDGREVPLDDALRDEIAGTTRRFADDSLRTLAYAYRRLPEGLEPISQDDAERDLVLVGVTGMYDPPREDVRDAIAVARKAGIKLVMITGDFSRTAFAVGREIGFTSSPDYDTARAGREIVEDRELDMMSDEEVMGVLRRSDVIFSRTTPLQKLRIVRVLQNMGEVVAVTGDGVNDAPALKMADVGIAMGVTGTDVAREAADVVLLDDDFASIVHGVEQGRAVFRNLRKATNYIFSSNFAELIPFLLFVLLPVPLLLPVILLLCLDLGANVFSCIVLGLEPPESRFMEQPPRGPGERLLDPGLLRRAFVQGLAISCVSLGAAFYVLFSGGWVWGTELPDDSLLYRQACSAFWAGLMTGQAFNLLGMRSGTTPVHRKGLGDNPLLPFAFVSIAISFAVAIYLPPVQPVLSTAPFPPETWLIMLAIAPVVWLSDTVYKRLTAPK